MRVVLDTGIFISALITKDTPPDMLYGAWKKGSFTLITSWAQLEELERVMSYRKLQKFIKPNEARFLLGTVHAVAEIIDPIPDVNYSPDPDDNKIIATAIAGEASILVSGDKSDILFLKSVANVRFMSAREAVRYLGVVM